MIKKLRDLKKLEIKLRYGTAFLPGRHALLWSRFFTDQNEIRIRYPNQWLLTLDRERRKKIFQEFLYTLYITIIKEKGLEIGNIMDSSLLELLGLPYTADVSAVKHRFRELFKTHHPDTGGDHEQIIRILELYDKCFPGQKGA